MWIVRPSEKSAERKRRELFAQSKEAVWMGETIFSLPHFLKTVTIQTKPLLKRASQKHLIAHGLKKTPLRYFEKLKHLPSLAGVFLEAIKQLKRFLILPDDLEVILKESGSLKEHDLWRIYSEYEETKEKLGFSDEEDLYSLPWERFDGQKLVFENFIEIPPALANRIPGIPTIQPAELPPVSLFSLPTPFQETDWFVRRLESLLEKGVPLYQIGILIGTPNINHEAIWQKLKNLGFLKEESPLLPYQALPLGRKILKEAARIEREEATLDEWIEHCSDFLGIDALRFQDHILAFGKLSKREWLGWLKEVLNEKPEIKISSALDGLQWLETGDADFASLQYLWVPGLIEGEFPALAPTPFFQDKKDRGLKGWKILCEAFPEIQTSYEQKQKAFLYQLSRTQSEVWLTYPRLNSFGQDVSPSPFVWDFKVEGPAKGWSASGGAWHPLHLLQIEKEREQNRLETKEYHAFLETKAWKDKIAPMREGHIFSPSQLETYAQCPFKYYAGRILNIPQKKEYAPEVDADDKGTLFHEALEKFLKENGREVEEARKEPAKEGALFEQLEKTVDEIFAKNQTEMSYANPELYRTLKEKTFAQAKLLIGKELNEARNLEAPLQPAYFEWCFGTGKEPPLELGAMKVGGRVDRIDIDPITKRFLVLDYKTGTIQKFKERRLQGLALQLPLYILAARKLLLKKGEAIGGLLVATKTAEKKTGLVDSRYNETHFSIHKRSSSLLQTEEFEKAIAETVQWVETYVKQIRSGVFNAQPKECKTSCDYKEICRYPHKPVD